MLGLGLVILVLGLVTVVKDSGFLGFIVHLRPGLAIFSYGLEGFRFF